MYRQSFSCKINRAKVKYTATKLHISPDKTDRARSLLQKTPRDSDSTPAALNPYPDWGAEMVREGNTAQSGVSE